MLRRITQLYLPVSTLSRRTRTRRELARDLLTFAAVLSLVLGAVAVMVWLAIWRNVRFCVS